MKTYRVEVIVNQDGTLILNDLPFHHGETVEIMIVERVAQLNRQNRYPLRGQPLHYEDPTGPVVHAEWTTQS